MELKLEEKRENNYNSLDFIHILEQTNKQENKKY